MTHPYRPKETFRAETEGQLLVCEAQRFYPPELNISWSFSAEENPAQETLNENPDGTYNKTSTINVTEELWDTHVICQVQHVTLPMPLPLRLYLTWTKWYQNLYVLLSLLLLPLVFLLCWKGPCRKCWKAAPQSITPGPGTARGPNTQQDGAERSSLHYASVVPSPKGTNTRLPPRSTEEILYAPLKGTRNPMPKTAPYSPDLPEEPDLFYASLRMSPPQSN
ncbi:hypothetical protein XELAEV_18011226mg [Xenopus laevis]|uniref:Ig-like domain-containing protein n=1 Tax=Xenopus laevis TaxID=8355 RepID=A0A974DK72_XENLA|nr:hypothetical protein XELAEV_18011226mg [Xenopus laevis]